MFLNAATHPSPLAFHFVAVRPLFLFPFPLEYLPSRGVLELNKITFEKHTAQHPAHRKFSLFLILFLVLTSLPLFLFKSYCLLPGLLVILLMFTFPLIDLREPDYHHYTARFIFWKHFYVDFIPVLINLQWQLANLVCRGSPSPTPTCISAFSSTASLLTVSLHHQWGYCSCLSNVLCILLLPLFILLFALSSLIFPFINIILILKSLSFVKAFLSTLSAKCSLLSLNSHHLGHYTGVRLFPLTLSVIFSWARSLSLPIQMVSPEQVSGSLSCFSAPSIEYCK